MSLILEALRKREREKQVPERGFLVMAPAPWAAPRGRGLAGIALAVVAAFGLGVGLMAWRAPRAATVVASPPAAAQPQPLRTTPGTLLPAPLATPRPVPRAEPGPSQPAMPVPSLAAAAAPPPEPRFVLQAISARDGQPVALINDRLMRQGDEWQGARVVRIGETEVELEVAGQPVILRF